MDGISIVNPLLEKVMKETAIKESDLKEYDLNKSNHDMIDDIFRG